MPSDVRCQGPLAGVLRPRVSGMATTEASVKVGVSRRTGWLWWRQADGREGKNGLGGLASPGDRTRPEPQAIGSALKNVWRSCVAAMLG